MWDLRSSLWPAGSLSCILWALVLWPGIEPGPPALGAWGLSYWTTREVPVMLFILKTYTYLEQVQTLKKSHFPKDYHHHQQVVMFP